MPKYSSSELYDEVIEAAMELKKDKVAFNLTQLARKVNEIRRKKGVDVEVKISSVSNVMKKLQRLGLARREGNLWTILPEGAPAPVERHVMPEPLRSPPLSVSLPSRPRYVLSLGRESISPGRDEEGLKQRIDRVERRLNALESSVSNKFDRLLKELGRYLEDIDRRLSKLEERISS